MHTQTISSEKRECTVSQGTNYEFSKATYNRYDCSFKSMYTVINMRLYFFFSIFLKLILQFRTYYFHLHSIRLIMFTLINEKKKKGNGKRERCRNPLSCTCTEHPTYRNLRYYEISLNYGIENKMCNNSKFWFKRNYIWK